jgi:hypothetical protein
MNAKIQFKLLNFIGILIITIYVMYKSIYLDPKINYLYISSLFIVLYKISKQVEKLRTHFTLWIIFWNALFVCFFQNDLKISTNFVLLIQLLLIPILIYQIFNKNEHK